MVLSSNLAPASYYTVLLRNRLPYKVTSISRINIKWVLCHGSYEATEAILLFMDHLALCRVPTACHMLMEWPGYNLYEVRE